MISLCCSKTTFKPFLGNLSHILERKRIKGSRLRFWWLPTLSSDLRTVVHSYMRWQTGSILSSTIIWSLQLVLLMMFADARFKKNPFHLFIAMSRKKSYFHNYFSIAGHSSVEVVKDLTCWVNLFVSVKLTCICLSTLGMGLQLSFWQACL